MFRSVTLMIHSRFFYLQSAIIFRQIFRGIMSTRGSGDKDAIADKVKQLINDHQVMVFSKTYCNLFLKNLPI
jgi:hypothetical protein